MMLNSQINSSEWKLREQIEINEPSNPHLVIEELRTLVKSDSCLKSRMDDTFMLKFLRAKKYHVNKAFKLIQSYYDARKKNPALFMITGPSKYRDFSESGSIFVLPYRDQRGREIYVFRIAKVLPRMTIEDIFKMNLMILEIISEDSDTQLSGMVAIADFTGFEWQKHYCYLSPYYAKKSAEAVQVHFHGNDFNSLHKHFSPSILPKYFGGTMEFDPLTWAQQFLNKEHYFEAMGQYGYDR